MPIQPIRSTDLYYELSGAGPPLVFISGLGSDHSAWDLQAPEFAQSYQCLTYDHRGIGSSPLGDLPEPYRIELLADDLAELLDRLELDRVHMLGQSMGGTVAQAFALRYPERLLSLSLHVTWARAGARLRLILEEQLHYLELLDLPEVVRMLGPYVWSNAMLTDQMDVIRDFRQQRRDATVPVETYRLQLRACLELDLLDRLSSLSVPALVTGAEEDWLVSAGHAREIASVLPNCRYHEFKQCGHAVSLERAVEFREITTAWIEAVANEAMS
jgi:pimeloyl-ACP methyl ester carboxylesterase